MGKSYAIITPAKNEERNLPFLAESMLKQTIKPAVWLIVDDGSDDGTPGIIEELASKSPWIHSRRLEKSQISNIRELDAHFSQLIKGAFDHTVDLCARGGIEYEYIGQVDGDMILPPDYFDKIIDNFEQNPKLGIAGGHCIITKLDERGNIIQRSRPVVITDDGPHGGCRLIRRDCFQEIGGIPLTTGQDGATLAKARLCGWETKKYSEIEILHLKKRGSAKWDGYINYCSDFHPLLVLLTCLLSPLVTREPFRGVVYLYGYFSALLKREQKTADQSLRYYFRHKRLKEIKQLMSLKVKNKFKNLVSKT